MEVIKFKLTEKHINVLQIIDWEKLITGTKNEEISDDVTNLFNGTNIYEDMGYVLYGQNDKLVSTDDKDLKYNPFEDDLNLWDDEKMKEMDLIYSQLPVAIEIVIGQIFNADLVGTYKCKHQDRIWKKIS